MAKLVRLHPHLGTATRPSTHRLGPPAQQLGQGLCPQPPTLDSERCDQVPRPADLSPLLPTGNRIGRHVQDRATTPDEIIRFHRLTFQAGAPPKLVYPGGGCNRLDRTIHFSSPPRKPARPLAFPRLLPNPLQCADVGATRRTNGASKNSSAPRANRLYTW